MDEFNPGAPGQPMELIVSAEPQGIKVEFNAAVDSGGCDLTRFTVTVNDKLVKTQRIIPPQYAFQSCFIGYMEGQAQYNILVSLENAAGLCSAGALRSLSLGTPGVVTDLNVLAGDKGINVNFTAPAQTGGCPIMICNVYDVADGATKCLLKGRIDLSNKTQNYLVPYNGKQTHYVIFVSVQNVGGFESVKMTTGRGLSLKPPKRLSDFVNTFDVVYPAAVILSGGIETGHPRGSVVWRQRKNNFPVTLSEHNPKYQYRNEGGVECLVINETSYEDEGRYFCEIVNHLGKCSTEVHLLVEGAPVLKHNIPASGKTELDYLATLKLKATVVSNPTPTYQWAVNEKVIEDHQSLEVIRDHVIEEDAGKYLLTAENKHGVASLRFHVTVKRNVVFIISGISDSDSIQTKVEDYNKIAKEGIKGWFPVRFVAVDYENEDLGITRQKREEEDGFDNPRLSLFDRVYRDYSFAVRHFVADGLSDVIEKLKTKLISESITDTYSFLGIGGGGGILRDFLERGDHSGMQSNDLYIASATFQSHQPLEEKRIRPPIKKIVNYETLKCSQRPDEPQRQSDESKWLKEFMGLIAGKEVPVSSGILITGFYKQRVAETLKLLTDALENSEHRSQFFCGALTKSDDIDEFMHPSISKVILVATFTERMNLLHEGVDAGQVTEVFYKARNNDMDVLLLCLGLPKSDYRMEKSQDKCFHTELRRLFRAQTLLMELAKHNRFISLLTGSTFDNDQIEALNAYLHPVKLKMTSGWSMFKIFRH